MPASERPRPIVQVSATGTASRCSGAEAGAGSRSRCRSGCRLLRKLFVPARHAATTRASAAGRPILQRCLRRRQRISQFQPPKVGSWRSLPVPGRTWKGSKGVDMACSPSRPGSTALCAKQTYAMNGELPLWIASSRALHSRNRRCGGEGRGPGGRNRLMEYGIIELFDIFLR